jgi:DNA invertase Pin-like site-specific DNA recombinase
MLNTFAEFERAMFRERCAAGFEAARARGQKFGRERSLPAKVETKLVRMYQSHKYTMQAWPIISRFMFPA